MKCPGCAAAVDDGTSICPRCDYIIDDSFLRSEPAPSAAGGEATSPGTPIPRPPPRRKTSPPAAGGPGVRKANGVRAGRPPTRKRPAVQAAPAPAAAPAQAPLSSAPPPAPLPVSDQAPALYTPVFKPEETLEDARQFVRTLTTADKLTLTGSALMLVCSFFPWKDTAAEGELLGLETMGWVALCGMMVALAAMVARNRRLLVNASSALPWLVQLAATGFSLVWCVVFIRLSWDSTLAPSIDGNIMVAVSAPALGVYLGALASLLGLGGTVMGLKETPP